MKRTHLMKAISMSSFAVIVLLLLVALAFIQIVFGFSGEKPKNIKKSVPAIVTYLPCGTGRMRAQYDSDRACKILLQNQKKKSSKNYQLRVTPRPMFRNIHIPAPKFVTIKK